VSEPPLIDHIPNEQRPSKALWWVLWAAVILLWVWYLYFFEFDWPAIAIGGFTMGVLITWSVEMTGNKVPGSWRR
jgi:hypothetical protein